MRPRRHGSWGRSCAHAGAGGSFPGANLTQNHTELPGVLQAEPRGAGRVTDASPGPALRRLEDVTPPCPGTEGLGPRPPGHASVRAPGVLGRCWPDAKPVPETRVLAAGMSSTGLPGPF